MNLTSIKKNKKTKALVIILELLALAIFAYLVILPFYPGVEYIILETKNGDSRNMELVEKKVEAIKNHLPDASDNRSANRLIITKIGVNAPIIESQNEKYGLNRGAWRLPESATPDKGGNTVITGHRFKYFPPNNLTFYLLDKLAIGDIIFVSWQERDYYYKVNEIKKVKNTDISVLNQTDKKILTLFTCDPIFSQENRLVVIGELL
jgi:sortase A